MSKPTMKIEGDQGFVMIEAYLQHIHDKGLRFRWHVEAKIRDADYASHYCGGTRFSLNLSYERRVLFGTTDTCEEAVQQSRAAIETIAANVRAAMAEHEAHITRCRAASQAAEDAEASFFAGEHQVIEPALPEPKKFGSFDPETFDTLRPRRYDTAW